MEEARIKTEIIISPEQRRQIQLIQLEVLIEIDRICRKHNIVYRLIGGTLLGAVRHKGFIPWDPDADISMNRYDYNRFFEICKEELDTKRFFLQEWRTDPHYRWNYTRILRKNTVFVRAGHEELKSRNGIFVDIICADRVPDIKILRPLHCFSCYAIRKTLWSVVGRRLHPNVLIRIWYSVLSLIPRNWIFYFRNWIISWNGEKLTELSRNMAHKVSDKSPSRWGYTRITSKEMSQKVYSGELPWNHLVTELEFEGYYFLVSKYYETALKSTFGDYMKLPPREKRISHIPCSKLKLIKPELKNYDKLIEKIYYN